MRLVIVGRFLVVRANLGFDDSLKFEVRFLLSEVKELIDDKKQELFKVSESEDEVSAMQDYNEWGEDL